MIKESPRLVKLNLGCGDKLYPIDEGWVNVDAIEPKKLKENFDSIISWFNALEQDEKARMKRNVRDMKKTNEEKNHQMHREIEEEKLVRREAQKMKGEMRL